MQLYFIRHAQSENNAHWGDETFQESHDPILTKIAFEQLDHLVHHLCKNLNRQSEITWNPQNRQGFGITHIYTSLMVRAVNTAYPIAQAINLPLYALPEIHETGGIYSRIPEKNLAGLPGKPRSFFESNFPELILPDCLDELGWWQNRPFESCELRQKRANRVWANLLSTHGDQYGRPEHRVALISHGGFFMHFLTTALNIDMPGNDSLGHKFWFLMNNCGITRLDIGNGRVFVSYINRTDFLPDHLIT